MPGESSRSLSPEGFLAAGDHGIVGGECCLRVVGRRHETTLPAGHRLYPHDVEDRLRGRSAVDDVRVIGAPPDVVGAPAGARVVPVEGAVIADEESEDFARDAMAECTIPDLVRLFDAFPMTGSGKAERRELGRPDRRPTTLP